MILNFFNSMIKWPRSFKQEARDIIYSIKDRGFKKSYKTYGWRLLRVILIYYLVRDILIYIVMPSFVYLAW